MTDNKIEAELKTLLREAEQHVFNEYCPSCYQDKMCCDTCNAIVNGEPVRYLSARDAYELEEAHSYGDYLND